VSISSVFKRRLVKLGPKHPALKLALRYEAKRQGYRLQFASGKIAIEQGNRRIELAESSFILTPFVLEYFGSYFSTVCSDHKDGFECLDFSAPRLQRYIRQSVSLWAVTVPEEDVIDAYTHWYPPRPGDIVFDLGAHAGVTAYQLAQMVGPAGVVYAFEPDDLSYEYLLKNIELHRLTNVIPVKKAIAGRDAALQFNMDGSIAAGLVECVKYTGASTVKTVEALTLETACRQLGVTPSFIKMDVEGAESDIIAAASDFLRENPIHFAIESGHVVRGKPTHEQLDILFRQIGYTVATSHDYGEPITWARPAHVFAPA